MRTSENINELAAALSKAQGAFTAAERAHVAKVQSKKGEGSSYSYNYADLAAYLDVCREPLLDNGLSIVQDVATVDDRVTVVTKLMHSSGQWFESSPLVLVADHDPDKHPTPQAIGSATTYARRYSMSAVLGMASEADDDGAAASGVNAETGKREPLPNCPKCQTNSHVIIGKPEYGGGYVCYGKKGGCGEKWHLPNSAELAAAVKNGKGAVEALKEQGQLTTADQLPTNIYQSALESLSKYTKVSELVTFAGWIRGQKISKAVTDQQYHDLNNIIAAKLVEFPTNAKGFEAAENLLRSLSGDGRISEQDYIELGCKLSDAKDAKLGVPA